MNLVRLGLNYSLEPETFNIESEVCYLGHDGLSSAAVALYTVYLTRQNTEKLTDEILMEELKVSVVSFRKYKNQLKKFDLLLEERLSNKSFARYIGSLQLGASKVKKYWARFKVQDKYPITDEEKAAMKDGTFDIKKWENHDV